MKHTPTSMLVEMIASCLRKKLPDIFNVHDNESFKTYGPGHEGLWVGINGHNHCVDVRFGRPQEHTYAALIRDNEMIMTVMTPLGSKSFDIFKNNTDPVSIIMGAVEDVTYCMSKTTGV